MTTRTPNCAAQTFAPTPLNGSSWKTKYARGIAAFAIILALGMTSGCTTNPSNSSGKRPDIAGMPQNAPAALATAGAVQASRLSTSVASNALPSVTVPLVAIAVPTVWLSPDRLGKQAYALTGALLALDPCIVYIGEMYGALLPYHTAHQPLDPNSPPEVSGDGWRSTCPSSGPAFQMFSSADDSSSGFYEISPGTRYYRLYHDLIHASVDGATWGNNLAAFLGGKYTTTAAGDKDWHDLVDYFNPLVTKYMADALAQAKALGILTS